MNATTCYIAGDWGTSNLRLFLVDKSTGACLAKTQGPGVAQLDKVQIPALLNELTGKWQQQYSVSDMLLCGMVGSTIGWQDAGYADCPLALSDLADHLCDVDGATLPTRIVPGIRCHSPTGATDIMRGEETQLLGALQSQPELATGNQLLCLPGTHSKWVAINNGVVENFLTSLSGELFAILKNHSILARDAGSGTIDEATFLSGVQRSTSQSHCDLTHLLFETRSRQISGELPAALAGDFLSGLIIGRDIQNALKVFKATLENPIYFIANPSLNHLYDLACEQTGIACQTLDGDQLSLSGMQAVR
ncbi:MAG: 2-dehydro-3-deoxygalactonokinase [Porticoccaceae bacterium]|nr:2-dehydro-3-deoxygalactonokinase [Porticoccaceae bacterium]